MKRHLASCLSALIIISTPGLAPYQALAQNIARPVGRVGLIPVLTVLGSAPGLTPSAFAPGLMTGPSLNAPSLSPLVTPSEFAPALLPVALTPIAAVAVTPITSAPIPLAVQALRALTLTPKLAESASVLKGFYDQTGTRDARESALDATLSAASKETRSGLYPWLPAARPETSVIGAARTSKGYARAAARRLADGWPYFAIAAVAVLAHHFFGPEAAFAVLMAAGPCAAFRAMQDGEALRLGINDENRRRQAMTEMQQIFRQFGRDAAKEGDANPEIQSRVDAEIMTRSALQGVTHALEHFLKILRAEELELPAAKERLKLLVRSAVVGALKANGMPGDGESMIQKILDKTGLTTKVMDWESRHMVVESILAAVREEKKKGSTSASAPGSVDSARKEKGSAAGSVKLWPLSLLVAGTLLLASIGHAWAVPAVFFMMGPIAKKPVEPKQPAQPELPPLPDTPMVHHLQLAGYEREEIEFFLSATRDVAEAPASPVDGRHEEIRRAVETLSRPVGRPRNLLLVGPEGAGKRSLVETLAREIAEKRYKGLEDARVLEFDASSAVGGNVEGLALQLRALLAKSKGKVLLYIDGPGHLKNQNLNELNFFKIMASYMSRGDVTLIVTADAAERRLLEDRGPFPFETVELTAPTSDKAAAMLEAHAPSLASRYGLRAVPGLFEAAARLAARYLAKTSLPGSGLDLLERAYSARSAQSRANRAEAEIRRRLERMTRNLRRLKEGRDEPEVAMRRRNALSEDLDALHMLRELIVGIALEDPNERLVSETDLAEEASRLSGIPASKMLQSEREKLLSLEGKLKNRVVHQDEAVTAVSEAVRRARAGLKDPNKPIGSFLFLGPTGVGKTELTKALAETLFDSEANMIRLDMSEYMEPHSVSRLIGSPPGYVGFDAGGQLTEAVREKPYSVVLLDEVEKAHPDVLNVLLQAMDDGRITDGQGRTVSFSNVIFVLTSNLGSVHIMELMKGGADRTKIKDEVMGAVRQHFRPEFINRLDETVIFNPLGREQAGPIVDIHLNAKVRRWLSDQDIELERASKAAVERLADLGFDPLYGGRPLARAIQRFVLNPLSMKLLSESSEDDERVRRRRKAILDVVDGVITPRLIELPFESVSERKPQHPAASALWLSLLDRPEAELGTEAVEAFLFGPPEKDLPSAEHGAFKPMGALKGGDAVETISAATDDPNLKDAELDRAIKLWSAAAKIKGDAGEAFRRWMSKVARCAKSTNNLRPAPHELVSYSVHEGAGFREYRVKGLPLTRAELILNARIFENHYAKDSIGEDQSWELADALLTQGEYGRAELFEIKRLIGAIPDAEFGYYSDRAALTFWLRLPSDANEAPAKAAPAAQPTAVPAAPAVQKSAAPIAISFNNNLPNNQVLILLANGKNAAEMARPAELINGETFVAAPSANGILVTATPARAVALAVIFVAQSGIAEVRLSESHRFDVSVAPAPAPTPVDADDSEADAHSKYRFLTQNAPEHLRRLHAMTAGLLSSADPIAVFWGYRFARASLGEKGFEPMRKFLPPIVYLNTDARNAYLAEETLRPYYQAPVANPGAPDIVRRAISGGRNHGRNPGSDQTSAARELALSGILPADLSKTFTDGIIAPYKTFVKKHKIHMLTRRITLPLWIAAVAACIINGDLISTWPITSFATVVGIIVNNVAGFSGWFYDDADLAYNDARAKLEVARIAAPSLQPADRARLAEYFETVLRGRWAANKREKYYRSNGRDGLRDGHLAAAQGLNELRAELKPKRIRALADLVMKYAGKPSKKSPMADRLAPLMMLDLLEDAQKTQALALALEHVAYDGSAATIHFLRLAREGRLPSDKSAEVIQQLVRALGTSDVDTATVAAMSETIAVLAAAQPDNMRLATFEAVFGARNQFHSAELGNEKPVEYYAALRSMSPHRRAMERVADHLLGVSRPKIAQLSWLLSLTELSDDRREKVLEMLMASAEGDPRQDATWNAIPVIARMAVFPRERRVQLLLNALNRLSHTETARGNEFTYYARAVEAVKILTELEAAP